MQHSILPLHGTAGGSGSDRGPMAEMPALLVTKMNGFMGEAMMEVAAGAQEAQEEAVGGGAGAPLETLNIGCQTCKGNGSS